MKKSFVDYKIDEVYEVALKLGLSEASDFEKKVFKDALYQIAVASVDEFRGELIDLAGKMSNKYTNGNRDEEG